MNLLRLQVSVLAAGEVAGAVFVYAWQFSVADDSRLGIILMQLLQQLVEGVLLQLGAGVGSITIGVKASFVADGYRTVVVTNGMNTTNALWQNGDDAAIAAHVIVIRRLAETFHAGFYKSLC